MILIVYPHRVHEWKLKLNLSKCAAMCVFISSRSRNAPASYNIQHQQISSTNKQKDLGVLFTSNVSWLDHFSSKAYCSLNLIRRSIPSCSSNVALFLTLVRSHLSYCSQVWRPYKINDIRQLENIQRRATKFILSDYSSDYKSRLQSTQLSPIMYWLELQDLMFFIKSLKEPPDNLNISDYVSFVSGNIRTASTSKLSIKYTYYRSSRHFFFTRIARLWNSIPSGTFSILSSLPKIKFQLYIYFLHHFRENFDSNNVCSFCPCSRCIPV